MTTKTPILRNKILGLSRERVSHRLFNFFFNQFNLRISRAGLTQVRRKGFLTTLGTVALSCPLPPTFDPGPCELTGVTDGGGDTLDCYAAGDASNLPLAGTGFTGIWRVGDSPFGTFFGDTFETYAAGAPGTMDAGTGFTGAWLYD